MVFIRKKLVEDDFTTKTASELVDAGIEKIASQDTPATDAPSTPTTEDVDKDSLLQQIIDDDIEILYPEQQEAFNDLANKVKALDRNVDNETFKKEFLDLVYQFLYNNISFLIHKVVQLEDEGKDATAVNNALTHSQKLFQDVSDIQMDDDNDFNVLETEDADEVSGKSTVSMGDAKLTPDQEAEIEDIASLGESSSYNWNEILTILADYVNLDVIQQIEDDWMQNYPDGKMSQEDVDDLLNDIDESSYTEELKNEIKSRIEQLQSSSDELVGESETLEEGSNAKIDTLLKRKQISVKTSNRLKNAGIDTIGKLEELPFKEVYQIVGRDAFNRGDITALLDYIKIDTSRFIP